MMTQLQKGQIGRIEGVDGPAHLARRLAELGVMPGALVEMLRPGRPCILRVNRTRLSLGYRLQAQVRVSPALVADGGGAGKPIQETQETGGLASHRPGGDGWGSD